MIYYVRSCLQYCIQLSLSSRFWSSAKFKSFVYMWYILPITVVCDKFCFESLAPAAAPAVATTTIPAPPTSAYSHSYMPLQQYTPQVSSGIQICYVFASCNILFRAPLPQCL